MYKTVLRFSLLICFLVIQSSAKTVWGFNPPPDSIEKAFREKFPNALNNKWTYTSEKNKEYVVEFTMGKEKIKAFFNTTGDLVETEKEISPELLPEKVKQSIATQFQVYKILKSTIIEKHNNVHCYELVIKSDGVKTTLIMSKDGYMIAR